MNLERIASLEPLPELDRQARVGNLVLPDQLGIGSLAAVQLDQQLAQSKGLIAGENSLEIKRRLVADGTTLPSARGQALEDAGPTKRVSARLCYWFNIGLSANCTLQSGFQLLLFVF